MISANFLKLKRPSFGNMYVHHGIVNLTCIVIAVDLWCVCGCVCLGVAGGSQYTTSCEPLCGLAVFVRQAGATSESWNRYLKHYTALSYIHVLATCSRWLSYMTLYSHVTLSMGLRGHDPSHWRTAGSEVNLTSKVEFCLFVLWWYIVRVEEVGWD